MFIQRCWPTTKVQTCTCGLSESMSSLEKFTTDLLVDFARWSKQAEWYDGTKQMFIKNDWKKYVAEFNKVKERK